MAAPVGCPHHCCKEVRSHACGGRLDLDPGHPGGFLCETGRALGELFDAGWHGWLVLGELHDAGWHPKRDWSSTGGQSSDTKHCLM